MVQRLWINYNAAINKVFDDFDFASPEVSKMEKLPWVKDRRY